MDIRVRGQENRHARSTSKVLPALAAGLVIGSLFAISRRAARQDETSLAMSASSTITEAAPRQTAAPAPLRLEPAPMPSPAPLPVARIDAGLGAAAPEASGLDLLSFDAGDAPADAPRESAGFSANSELSAANGQRVGTEDRGTPSAGREAAHERARGSIASRGPAQGGPAAAARRQGFAANGLGLRAASRLTQAESPSGARAPANWPTLAQLTQAFAQDAATLNRIAPLIAADPGQSFAMVTNMAAASPSAAQQRQGGSGASGAHGGASGGSSPNAAASDDSSEPPLPKPGPSPIPWRAAADATGLIFPDISMWRVPKDWDALNEASKGIIVMKVRQVGVDPMFNKGLEEAEKRKMIVVGYAFGYGTDGADQADAMLLNFPPKAGRVIMLDLERNPYGSSMTDQQAMDFVNRIQARTGRLPMLYASASRARPGVLAKCPRYVAQWGSQPADSDIWQFTDGVYGPQPHAFAGVGSCDINRLMMPYAKLRRLAGLDVTVASAK